LPVSEIQPWTSLRAHPFFSSVIRIHSDRGHRVISVGPYSYVRHPGYAAGIVMALSSGIALGLWVSLVPSLVGCAVLVQRTIVEDRILRADLAGYGE
jgi:protein-S-isoprenylcysteine O-methyltransferase Ste14